MSKESINFFINNSFIDTGNLKIFYNFTGQSGESPSTGSWQHKIPNTENIFSKKASFFLDFEKSGMGDCALFSNYNSGGTYPSGFAFGLTDSNNLFFETHDLNGPVVYTSNYNLSKRNLVNFQLSNNLLTFNIFKNNLEVESESFPINSNYILQSNDWYMGSGNSYETFSGNFYSFLYFNNDLSFESVKNIFSGFAYDVNSGTGGQFIPFSGLSGYENIYTGYSGITGYQLTEFQSGFEQTYFYTEALTGTLTNITGSIKVPIWTGACFSDVEDGIIYKWYDVEGSYTGVTGYELKSGLTTGYETIVTETPLSGFISGLSGQIEIYTTGQIFSGSGNSTVYNLDTGFLEKLNYNSILYLGERYENSISEVLYSQTGQISGEYNKSPNYNFAYEEFDFLEPTESGNQSFFLNGQFFVESGKTDGGTIYAPIVTLDEDYWLEDDRIANSNDFVAPNDFGIFDSRKTNIQKYTITGKYDADPNSAASMSINIIGGTGVKYTINDAINYSSYIIRGTNDFVNYNEITSGVITGNPHITKIFPYVYSFYTTRFSGFETGYLPKIEVEDNDYVFYNGQKLINGYDYICYSGEYLDNNILDVNDNLFVISFSESKESITGLFDYSGLSFMKTTPEYYLNGIRQKYDIFVEHSLENSLLAHQNSFLQKTGVIYNNEQNFFE